MESQPLRADLWPRLIAAHLIASKPARPGDGQARCGLNRVADDDTGPEGFYWAVEVSSNDTERRGEEDDPTLESVTIKS